MNIATSIIVFLKILKAVLFHMISFQLCSFMYNLVLIVQLYGLVVCYCELCLLTAMIIITTVFYFLKLGNDGGGGIDGSDGDGPTRHFRCE